MGSVGHIIHRVDIIDCGIRSGQGIRPDAVKIELKLTEIKGVGKAMKARVWLFTMWAMIKHLFKKYATA